MGFDVSVIYHTDQAESSHSLQKVGCGKYLTMTEGEIFIANLIAAMDADGLNEADLSRRAGLNRRAVTDLREGRVQSPKLSTVFALAKALNRDPGEMMGLGPRPKISRKVSDYLSQFGEDDQEQLLDAVRAVRSLRA